METCVFCSNPAEIEKILDAPFVTDSSILQTSRVIKICRSCDEQDKRMAQVSDNITLNIG